MPLVHFPVSVWLTGISHVRLSGLVRSFICCPFVHSLLSFVRSFVLRPFIWSHGLCVHPLPSAPDFPSCDCLLTLPYEQLNRS